jgi:hypothetical protein
LPLYLTVGLPYHIAGLQMLHASPALAPNKATTPKSGKKTPQSGAAKKHKKFRHNVVPGLMKNN